MTRVRPVDGQDEDRTWWGVDDWLRPVRALSPWRRRHLTATESLRMSGFNLFLAGVWLVTGLATHRWLPVVLAVLHVLLAGRLAAPYIRLRFSNNT